MGKGDYTSSNFAKVYHRQLQIQWTKLYLVKSVLGKKKSRIRETPTLSTDADSWTAKVLERLRDLPICTEKWTWSIRKCGLGPS